MNFYLVRCNTNKDDETYYLTNYIPYREVEAIYIKSVYFWPPKSMNGLSLSKVLQRDRDPYRDEVMQLGGPIPCGSVKNLITGEVIPFEQLKDYSNWQTD